MFGASYKGVPSALYYRLKIATSLEPLILSWLVHEVPKLKIYEFGSILKENLAFLKLASFHLA